MSRGLKVLVIEDSDNDAFLILHELKSNGYDLISERVDTAEAMRSALDRQAWDIIVSDFALPQFNGNDALKLRNEKGLNVPFILVSGKIGEETAVEMMKAGAHDYVMKDNLKRLVPAVERALREADLHKGRKQEEIAIQESENRFRTLFEYASDAICLFDRKKLRTRDCNRKAAEITGYTSSQLKDKPANHFFAPDAENMISRIFEKIAEHSVLTGISGINLLTRDGALVPVEISATMIGVSGDQYYLCIMRDISERLKTEHALKESEEKYRALFKNMFIGCALLKIVVNEHGGPVDFTFLEVNDAFEKLSGLKSPDIIGKTVTEVVPGINEEYPDLIRSSGEVAMNGVQTRVEMEIKPLERWYSISTYSPLKGYFVALFDDITDRKNTEMQLKTAAVTDDLTGLLTRRGFLSLGKQQITHVKRTGEGLALLYLDLDELKLINDLSGHKEGDRALMDTADLLRNTFRGSDIVARLGGDEFAVLLTDASPDTTDVITGHFRDRLKIFNKSAARPYKLSVSTGIVHFDHERPCSLDILLSKADRLMYRTKRKQKTDRETTQVSGGNMERRKYERHEIGKDYIVMLDDSHIASIKDISRGGVCLDTLGILPANTKYGIKIGLQGETRFKASVTSVWSSDTSPFKCGFRFADLSDFEKESLNDIIGDIVN